MHTRVHMRPARADPQYVLLVFADCYLVSNISARACAHMRDKCTIFTFRSRFNPNAQTRLVLHTNGLCVIVCIGQSYGTVHIVCVCLQLWMEMLLMYI
jgi:hypothetical protein